MVAAKGRDLRREGDRDCGPVGLQHALPDVRRLLADHPVGLAVHRQAGYRRDGVQRSDVPGPRPPLSPRRSRSIGQGRLYGRRPHRPRPGRLRVRRRVHRRHRLCGGRGGRGGRRSGAGPDRRRVNRHGERRHRSGQTVSGTVAANSKTTYDFTVPAGTVGYFAADPACKQNDNSLDLERPGHDRGSRSSAPA